jgi:hypothetical protein
VGILGPAAIRVGADDTYAQWPCHAIPSPRSWAGRVRLPSSVVTIRGSRSLRPWSMCHRTISMACRCSARQRPAVVVLGWATGGRLFSRTATGVRRCRPSHRRRWTGPRKWSLRARTKRRQRPTE